MFMDFRKAVLALAMPVLIGLLSSVQANPVCTTTIVLPGGNGTVLDSSIAAGVCVQSTDKLYGNFNLAGLPTGGSIDFSSLIVGSINRHTITFTNPFLPSNSYSDGYEVQVLLGGGFPPNNFISQLSADITQTMGGPTTLMQTTTPAGSASINISKTGNVVSGNFVDNFTALQDVTDLLVTGSLTTGAGSDASAILDTIVEAQPTAVPEPSSLVLLGAGLLCLLLGSRKPASFFGFRSKE